MDLEEFGEWLDWGVLAFVFVAMVAAALMVLAVGIKHAIRYVQDHYGRRGRRGGSGGGEASIEELLASIPDVAYRELPAGDDDAAGGGVVADDGSRYRHSCAICVTPYEAGEPCSVLPGCTHMFHKPCVAEWLRQKNTCPLCRGTVGGVPVHPPPPRQAGVLDAAENMV